MKNQSKMKRSDVEKLSHILSCNDFKYNKCSRETRIKLIRIQILVDPVAKAMKETREQVETKCMSWKLRKYLEKYQGGKLEKEDVPEFNTLYKAYDEAYCTAIAPALDEKIPVAIDKLTESQYDELFDSNADWMAGDVPKFLYLSLVGESLGESAFDEKSDR